MLDQDSVTNFYMTNFQLIQHHKYSLSDLNEMIPWERNVYIELLANYLEKEAKRLESNT